MTKLSFLISTNRDYSTHAKKVVDDIEKQIDISNHEIIICSNEPIQDSRIINIEDELKVNGTLGFNQAAKNSTGDILLVLCDDHNLYIKTDIEKIFDNEFFNNKKYQILTMSTKQDAFAQPSIGPIPPNSLSYKRWLKDVDLNTSCIPKARMCRFPILSRDCYEKLGGYIFHPRFNLKTSFFPDNYLSYFLFINGEESVQTNDVYLKNFKNQAVVCDDSLYVESLKIFIDLIHSTDAGDPYVAQ